MELSEILSIAGKPGLFKVLHQSRGGVVVVSLTDGKKMSIGQTQRVSTLSDISVYIESGDEPLKNIFDSMLAYNDGKEIDIDVKDNDALRSFFTEILPEHDAERVYTSDIKKILKWYNTLVAKDMLTASTPETEEKASEEAETKEETSDSKKEETPKAKTKKVKKEEPADSKEKESVVSEKKAQTSAKEK